MPWRRIDSGRWQRGDEQLRWSLVPHRPGYGEWDIGSGLLCCVSVTWPWDCVGSSRGCVMVVPWLFCEFSFVGSIVRLR